MQKCLFSVIVPTLNEEKLLPNLLNSLSLQTYQNFEVIVVDGNSTDKTRDVFNKFKIKFKKATLLISEKNNVSYQRNMGAEKAQGEYLVFLDADVDMTKTHLEEIHLQAYKKKFKLATTWMLPDRKNPQEQILALCANFLIEFAKIVNRPFAGGYNTIVKKNIFLKLNGFNEKIKVLEDHEFTIRALTHDIELEILQRPRIIHSFRRIRSRGKTRTLIQGINMHLYSFFIGPITRELFDYQMGGHVHEKTQNSKLKFQN